MFPGESGGALFGDFWFYIFEVFRAGDFGTEIVRYDHATNCKYFFFFGEKLHILNVFKMIFSPMQF